MNDLLRLKWFSKQLNVCGKYRRMWDACNTPRDIVDMALSAQGVEFVCDGCAFGWGLSKEYILNNFGDYVNGRYQRDKDGYTSDLFVGKDDGITIRSTLNLLVGCNGHIVIPEWHICKIYVCDSNIALDCKGRCEIYVYGLDCNVSVINGLHSDVKIHNIDKSQWIKNI